MPTFSHLHVHTQYSLLDGATNISAMMKKAAADGMPAVALTDHGNMFGAFKFVAEAGKAGVKPVVGCEFYLVADRRKQKFSKEEKDQRFHQLLLAKDQAGYHNLAKLCSLGYLEGMYSKWPRIDKGLLEQYREGLIATTCCIGAEVPQAILNEGDEVAEERFRWWLDLFGDDYYVELQRHKMQQQEQVNATLLRFAKQYGVKVIASNDAHYLDRDDYAAHDVLLCVNTGELRSKPVWKGDGFGGRDYRFGFPNDEFYFKSTAEMAALFHDLPEALDNTNEIVGKITPPQLKRDILLPNFPIPAPFADADAYLRHLTYEGARKRYHGLPLNHEDTSGLDVPAEVTERLDHELNIIRTMGFAGYFLIVQDFINAGRSMGVAVGPGRGSAAGSAVAYCVGITNIDPIKYELLFERFLNPERVSMPDVDVDFDDAGRQRVIDYVVDKYGKEQVAQIITYGSMAAKSSIKDVARVLDLPLADANRLANLVPTQVGMTLQKAFAEVPELAAAREEPGLAGETLRMAEKLEGSVRNMGIHAAGVIIAPDDIRNYIPVCTSKDADLMVTQFDGKVIEDAGMLKMDFLGLKTLTVISNALDLIEQNHGVRIDPDNIPLDDEKTYALYQRGDTVGTFQFESEGMRAYLKDLRPTDINDLIAMNALYRPGPMDLIPLYINRKHGREPVEYAHPMLEPILKPTYAIPVYQEQVMQMAQVMGGFTLGKADIMRRGMGKKRKEIVDALFPEFLEGALAQKVTKKTATEVWELMAKFSGYGFNKCVVAETEIFDACSGQRRTVGELFNERSELNASPVHVHALGEDGRLRPRRVEDVVWNGVRPTYELITELGHRIVVTDNHPFRTLNGWTLLRDLRPGDRVAAPRRLATPTRRKWPRHELIVLAGLLSEGNTCHPSSLYFYGNERELIDDFAEAARQLPDTVVRLYTRPEGRRMEVCLNTGPQGMLMPGNRPWNVANGKPTVRKKSGAYFWAQQLGILGKKAHQKSVPAEIFALCDQDVALFLGRLWAGDGFIAEANNHTPYYATSSIRLAKDVQTLLLRLGMVSRVSKKTFRYRGGERIGFTVHLIGEGVLPRFLDCIAPHIVGRTSALEELNRYVATTSRGLTSKDTIPAEVRKWVNERRVTRSLTWQELETQSKVSVKEFCGRGSVNKRGFRRSTINRPAEPLECSRLKNVSNDDVFWDRVVRITPSGDADTYDLTVNEDHNFVANGLIVHNSHSAAYSVVAYQTGYLKANYPAEYMAAVLTNWIGNIEKITFFMEECKRMGLEVLGPDVNESGVDFAVNKQQQGAAPRIRFGLGAIKGAGEAAVTSLIEEREANGPYLDVFDFARRVNLKAVNKKTFESLAYAGAFDGFGLRRSQYFYVTEDDKSNLLEKLIRYGNLYLESQNATQHTLFASFGGDDVQ
ncbi:MAG: DNA polymerase III subunit alpha, partial [Catalinimonas sp.]